MRTIRNLACGIRNLRYVCIQNLYEDIPTYKKCTVGVLLMSQKKIKTEKNEKMINERT